MPKKIPVNPVGVSDVLGSLFRQPVSVDKEVFENLFTDENLEKKTELKNAIKWSVVSSIKYVCDQNHWKTASEFLDTLTKFVFRYQISNRRLGRKEYVEAMKNLATPDLSQYPTQGGM